MVKSRMSTCCIIVSIFLSVFAISLMIGGIVTLKIFPKIYKKKLAENKELTPASKTYAQWVEPTIPIYMKFYFFNCSNVEGFLKKNEKPILTEHGPYVFRELRKKINITTDLSGFGDEYDDSNIMYYQKKSWVYKPELSEGSLDDVIHTISVPAISAAYKMKYPPNTLVPSIISSAIDHFNPSLSTAETVESFLFKGHNDSLLSFAKTFDSNLPDKFGWYYKRNGTIDGPYIINNGKKDIKNVGFINTYKNMTQTPNFGKYCNYINGTAADVFPPFMYHDTEVDFFTSDLCRSLRFVYEKKVTVDKVKARRFIPQKYLFGSGDKLESNKCFCNGECIKYGLLNISSCKDGAPAFISFPHFLDADPSYRYNVIGMNPDPEKHRFIMDIQPDLGIPVNVAGRMQLNILVQFVPNITQLENITRPTYLPMMWFSQTARIDAETVDMLLFATQKIKSIVNGAAYGLIGAGVFILALIIIYHAYKIVQERESKKQSQGKQYELAPTLDSKDKEAQKEKEAMKEKEALQN